MLFKLSLRNAKKASKDYFIYMITTTIAFSLIFAFNSVTFSKEIVALSQRMDKLSMVVIFITVIIIGVVGWLINYTMHFMLEKRSKEFGLYLLLGIEKKDIVKTFIFENVLLGCISLFLSFFLGFIFSQCFKAVIMNVFELPFKMDTSINEKSIILSIDYFIGIYLVVLFSCSRKMKKTKIYDLLYLDKQNEKAIVKDKKYKIILFFISILCAVVSIKILFETLPDIDRIGDNAIMYVLLAITLLIISIYLFYFTSANFIANFALKNKRLKYHHDNMFILKNFSSKINSFSLTLGTLGVLICATLLCSIFAIMLKGSLDYQVQIEAGYDISIYEAGEDWTLGYQDAKEFIDQEVGIEEAFEYHLYDSGQSQFIDVQPKYTYIEEEPLIKVSDYNKLQEMLGNKPITIKEGEYLIHAYSIDLKNDFEDIMMNLDINIGNHQLKNKAILTSNYTHWGYQLPFVVVVNDEVVEGLEFHQTMVKINTKNPTSEQFLKDLEAYHESLYPEFFELEVQEQYVYPAQNVVVRGIVESDYKATIIIFSFPLFYLTFIFIITVCTILATQQLSESHKYKYRYNLLSKLGTDKSTMIKIIFKQLLVYFGYPLILPFVLSISITMALGHLFERIFPLGSSIFAYLGISFGLFMFIYSLYFLATFISFNKNIEIK